MNETGTTLTIALILGMAAWVTVYYLFGMLYPEAPTWARFLAACVVAWR